jgi:hypothetical protein
MGQRSGKEDRLFYSFNFDEDVPASHLLRGIDRYPDLTDLTTTSKRTTATPVDLRWTQS